VIGRRIINRRVQLLKPQKENPWKKMDSESKICFDSQLLFQGINLNKIVVLGSVLMTSLLLPIHLDDLDALDPSRQLPPSLQYLRQYNQAKASFPKSSSELTNSLLNEPLVLNSTKKATDFQNERMNRRQMNRRFRTKQFRTQGSRNLNSLNLENRDSDFDETDARIDQVLENESLAEFDSSEIESTPKSSIKTSQNLKTRSTLSQYTTPTEPSISLELALLPLLIWQLLAITGGAIGAVSFWKHEKAKREGQRARSPPVPVDSASILPDFVNRRRQAATATAENTTEATMLTEEMQQPSLTETPNLTERVVTRSRRSHARVE